MQLKREIRKQTNLYEPYFPDILVLVVRVDTTVPRSDPLSFLVDVRNELRSMGLNTFLGYDVREMVVAEEHLEDLARICNAVVFVRIESSPSRRDSTVETILDQLRPLPDIEYPVERRAIFFVEDGSSQERRDGITDAWGYPNSFEQRAKIARETWWEVQDIIGWEKDGTLPNPPGSRRTLNHDW